MRDYKKNIKYIIVFIIIVVYQLFLPLDLDEIWNYGFSNNIANGLIPYRDFNMVITPFFSFLYSIPLFIFKSNILIIYIQHAIIIVFSYYLLEKLYGTSSNIFLILIFSLFNCIYPSYNSFLMILTIILVYLEKKNKNDYLIGILLGLIILTKHSVGICMTIASFLCYIKKYKKIFKRTIGIFIPIIIFIIYLIITNSYNEFIDLCILGLFDFGKENRLNFNIVYILFVTSLIFLLYLIKKDNTNVNYWYSLGFLSIVIPMFDCGHFYYFIITFISLIVVPNIKFKRLNISLVTIFSIFGIMLFTFFQCYFEEKEFYYPNNINHFEYKYISKEHEKKLNKIQNLYKKYPNKKIVFIGRSSYFYKLISDKRINYLDLINTGNWGYNGSKKLEKKLSKQKKSLFVLDTTSFTEYDQSDITALKYIKKNCKKIGELDEFYLYITKE